MKCRDQAAGSREAEGSNLNYAHKLCFEYLDTAQYFDFLILF